MIPYFKSSDRAFTLLHGDCIELLKQFSFKFDMIFADPPYFLSNGGISVQSGKMVCVDKGEWDKGGTPEYIDSFNRAWISECQNKLKENGTIWISGTYHNIFSIANILTELGFKILNVVTWAKTNPPPNISCRYFTHSTEFIIWARKSAKITHYYNYSIMKQINSNKQMTDVWQLPAIARWEKSCGKHPTQKPLSVLSRIILASTRGGAWILDPFTGSSTTGIAANLLGRRFLGIDREEEFIGAGVSYCATCDGAFFRGKDVAVVGGGNTALEDAAFLANYCNIVYLIHRRDTFRGESRLVDVLKTKKNVKFILDSVVDDILGEDSVIGIIVKNVKSQQKMTLDIKGLFIAAGQIPDNGYFSDIVNLDEKGYISADETCRTDTKGVFTAGDCRTKQIRQLTTAASDGAVAALAACSFIDEKNTE
mgnify:CR=1 FL=1